MSEDLELMMSEIPANTTMDEVDDYLCHYGTSGMKWGKRLYQNLDGSLTPLGRLHYGIRFKNIGQVEAARRAKEKAKKEKEENERKKKEDERKAAVEKATRSGKAEDIYRLRESMTDDELYRAVTRMQSTQKLESALASIENERFSALNREPKPVKEPKKSIFEKARDKKAEKQAKEKAEAEAKKQQAMEALSKGMAVLDTVTKTTNSIVGAYQSYNKMASMINSLGGDKLPSQLPTWDTEPWKKPNDGKPDKGKKQEQQKPADNKQSNEKSWTAKDVKGLYSTGGSYSTDKSKFSYGSTWSTSDKQIADSGYSTIMSVLESSGGSKSYTPSAADYTDIDDYLEKAMRGESVRFFHSEEEAGVGGLVVSGGNPAAGLASASATFALNTARSAIRDASGTRAADYTNDLVIGREALNKLMENPDVYNFDMEKALGNYERSVQRGMAWDYKSGRGK